MVLEFEFLKINPAGCFYKVGVLIVRAVLLWVYIRAPDFCRLRFLRIRGSMNAVMCAIMSGDLMLLRLLAKHQALA